jgi:hypothetical protein
MKLYVVFPLMDETDCSLCLRLVMCGHQHDHSTSALYIHHQRVTLKGHTHLKPNPDDFDFRM